MGKKRQLFVSSVETFRDDGTPKAKTRYDRHGNVVGTTHYDEKGHPLSGICGDFMKWEMLDSHTIKISGNGDMDDFTTMASLPWQMHEITSVIIEEGIHSIGAHAFTSVHTNMLVANIIFPKSLRCISADAFLESEVPEKVLSPYWK